jgi:peptide/nickel transport system permease protein
VNRPITRLLLRRLLLGLLTLLLVSVVVFTATAILPGDAARAILGRSATEASLRALRAQLGLDRPIPIQYVHWLGGILTGHLGHSLVNGRPVGALVMPTVWNSVTLVGFAGIIGVPLAVLCGMAAALRRGRAFDTGISILMLAVAALPEFVVGICLVLLFATVVLRWLPPVSMVPPGTSVFDKPAILVLPVATLILVTFPYIFRMMRTSMITVLDSDYIEMARLKGISERRLVFVHALPNAIAPTIQVIALTFAYLAGGIVLVEYVFGFPGVGQQLMNGIFARDMPTIQFIVLLLAAFYVLVNVAADIIVILVTPRLRAGPWQKS